MFVGSRIPRALSVFKTATHRWAAIPLRDPDDPIPLTTTSPPADAISKQTLTLTSWNIQASNFGQVERSKLILDRILEGPKISDIIHLQEVDPNVRESLLDDPRVRSDFLTTDAEDDTFFKRPPFATMTFLSTKRFGTPLLTDEVEEDGRGGKLMLHGVSRMELRSRYGRDALCVEFAHPAVPGTVLRLLNVHLESRDAHIIRALQMHALADLLREPGCSGGIIAGDFNANSTEDHKLVDENKLLDAWVALHGSSGPDGNTWGVGVEREHGPKAGRFDKVAMLGLMPNEIEVLQPGRVKWWGRWSDHCGLRCTFTI